MAAETLTGLRAASTYPVQTQGAGSALYPVWGYYAKDSNALEAGDVFVMCRTPVNFLVLGGWFAADDMDTGTGVMDLDLGWSDNGGASETYTTSWGQTFTNTASSTSASGLLNNGAMNGTAVTNYIVGGTLRPLVVHTPLLFTRKTDIIVTCVTPANAGHTGNMSVCLLGQILA